MDLLPPTAPSLVFARETCRPYTVAQCNPMCPASMLCIVTLGSASDMLTLKCCGDKYTSQLHISGHSVYQCCTGYGQERSHILANIQRIGNKHYMKVWIWFQIWTYMLYTCTYYETKVRILTYITLLFYRLLLIIVKCFTVIRFLLVVNHAKLFREKVIFKNML